MALRPLSGTVEEAENGSALLEMLAAAENQPFDVVITDVYMPTLGGSNVVAMARTAGFTTPFIVITAHPNQDLYGALQNLDEMIVLEKPLERRRLLACVDAALQATPAPGSTPT